MRHNFPACSLCRDTTVMEILSQNVANLDFGYLVRRAPKLGHRTDGLWCVNNLPKVVT